MGRDGRDRGLRQWRNITPSAPSYGALYAACCAVRGAVRSMLVDVLHGFACSGSFYGEALNATLSLVAMLG